MAMARQSANDLGISVSVERHFANELSAISRKLQKSLGFAEFAAAKFPAEKFTVTAKVNLTARFAGEKFGVVVMGLDYSYLAVTNKGGKLFISQATAKDADKSSIEIESEAIELKNGNFYLRVKVDAGAMCQFSFSPDGRNFQNVGSVFKAREGKWIGAKVGLFFNRPARFNDAGTADIDWFRFEPNN